MKRPFLLVAISLIIGIIIGEYLSKSILFIFAILIVTLYGIIKKKIEYKAILASIIIILLAIFYTSNLNNRYENLYKQYDKTEITVIGIIESEIKETDYYYNVQIKVKQRDKLYNTKLNVYIKKNLIKDKNELRYGNRIKILGEYKEPEKARNYKGFDYKKSLRTKKIYGSITVDSEMLVISKNNGNIILRGIRNLSTKLKENLSKLLNEEEQGIVQGIVLGDTSKLNEDIKENFTNSSLSHMLAVSGAHVTYVMMAVNLLFPSKKVGIKISKAITIIVLIFFMIITNMSPSVTRAVICMIINICATLIYRKPDTINVLAISIVFILILNPFSLFNIGLELSYVGTIGIICFSKIFENKVKCKIKKYILDSIIVSTSANLVSFPLMAYYFNTISLNFIISNLVVSPILGLIIILGIVTLLVSIFSISLAKVISIPLKIGVDLIIKMTEFISNLPIKNILVITPPIIVIVIFYIFLFYTRFNFKKVKKNWKKLLSIAVCISLVVNIFNFKSRKFVLYFVDVGQGDCTLIITEENKKILIDGGGNSNSDVGKNILVPYLLDRGILKLDYVIISHFDYDHVRWNIIFIKETKSR